MCENSLKRRSAVRSRTLCTATNKGYLTSFKKTTNPNVSPIGERFGFECFGAGVLNQPKISHLKSGGWLTYFLVHLPTLCLFVMMIAQDFKEAKILLKSTNTMKATVFGTNCKATITFPAWNCRMRIRLLSVYGGSGTWIICEKISGYCSPTCKSVENWTFISPTSTSRQKKCVPAG